jgi:hypothetical protein
LLDLVFANFTDLNFIPVHSGLVKPDTYHPPLSTDVYLPHVNNNLNCEFNYRIFAAGNYTLLYNIFSPCDGSGVYETSSVDVAVVSLSAAVRDVVEQAIPRDYNRKFRFPPWFSNTLRYYTIKKNCFHRRFKNRINFMTNSPFTEIMFKTLSSLTGLGG